MRPTLITAFLIGLIVLCGAFRSHAADGDFSPEDLRQEDNCIFFDRNNRLLRFLPDRKGERHIHISIDEVPAFVKEAFIAIEDKRFYEHGGFDVAAMGRALRDNILHGRIVSGASTITQQTVRLMYPRKRTLANKLREIFRSSKLEGILDKNEILEQYLNRVPMGNNITGIGLASQFYFGKKVGDLSVSEAALLAALPKAPSFLNPYGSHGRALLKRKTRVLSEMAEEGYLSEDDLKRADEYSIIFGDKPRFPNIAPHFTNLLLGRINSCKPQITTTLDADIQKAVEVILVSHRERLRSRGGRQASAIVVHNPTMEVMAYAGSIAYSSEDKGYNNGITALRSAGSTLKPFLYAGALDQGYTASTLLEDVLRRYKTPLGTYSPDNFDRKEYGPVTLRSALGNSLNISAVRMLEALEATPMYELMSRLGLINYPELGPDHYGLGLVIGNIEVTLEELVAAYATLANMGIYRPLKYLASEQQAPGERIFSEEASFIIGDVLSDPTARMLTFGGVWQFDFPFRAAVKTGTSTKYRDGWAVGYTPSYTVAVWVGDFDGRPTEKITGAWGAGPILNEIIMLLHGRSQPIDPEVPEGVVAADVCGISGMKPGPLCVHVSREFFIKGTEPRDVCSFHRTQQYYHELSASYSGWLSDKTSRQQPGNYRITKFSREMEEIFEQDDGDLSGEDKVIHVRGDVAIPVSTSPVPEISPEIIHASLGIEPKDEIPYEQKGDVRIIYPLSGDRFLLDEDNPQPIRLESVVSAPLSYVDWFIDGRHVRRSGPPYRCYWTPVRGSHTIIAAGPDNSGYSINIIVE